MPSYELVPDYKQFIANFRHAWTNFRIPIFCKIHLVYKHLAEEVQRYRMSTALFNKSVGKVFTLILIGITKVTWMLPHQAIKKSCFMPLKLIMLARFRTCLCNRVFFFKFMRFF